MNFPCRSVTAAWYRRRRWFQPWPALLPVLTLLLFPACSVNAPVQAQKKPAGPSAVPVVTASVSQRTVPVAIRSIGNVEPSSSVEVRAMITGQLEKVHFSEGDFVAAGDLLFSLDPRPFQSALRQAEANLARDRAQLENARRNAERSASLVREGLIERQTHDQTLTAATALQATVMADEAEVESAKVDLGYTAIRAPLGGRTGDLMVDEGNLVQANSMALVTINQLSPIYVSFAVPEQHLGEIQSHMRDGTLTVTAMAPGGEGTPASGKLSFVDNAVDRNTGTIRLKATFENEDQLLWPGQFVQANLILRERPQAVVVPVQAVQAGQEGQFVFVVKADQTVEARPVKTSDLVDGNLMVVEEGLEPGEKVVTDGQMRLTPGVKIAEKVDAAPAVATTS